MARACCAFPVWLTSMHPGPVSHLKVEPEESAAAPSVVGSVGIMLTSAMSAQTGNGAMASRIF